MNTRSTRLIGTGTITDRPCKLVSAILYNDTPAESTVAVLTGNPGVNVLSLYIGADACAEYDLNGIYADGASVIITGSPVVTVFYQVLP